MNPLDPYGTKDNETPRSFQHSSRTGGSYPVSYLVKYKVLGLERSAGPYDSKEEALEHARDIAGYEYIRDVCVVPDPRQPTKLDS